MAENKESFVLYSDWIGLFNKLPDAKAGKLIKLVFDYVNDKNPETEDILLQVAFEPIKIQLKRDLKKWEAETKQRSEAGKKGGINSGKSRRSEAKRSSASKNEANEADNVNVTVNVNDTVNVKEFNTDQNIKFPIEHCLTVAMNDDRWARKNKASPEILAKFNDYLEGQGIYEFNPLEYKKYFHHWQKKEHGNKAHLGIIKPIVRKSEGAEQLLDSLRSDIEASGT